MAIEQWEIDLRNQLESKIAQEEVPQDLPAPKKPKDSGTAVGLVLAIAMGLLLLYMYDSKSGGKIRSWYENAAQCPVEPGPINFPKAKSYDLELSEIRSELKLNRTELEKLAKKTTWNTDRITLMGTMVNENFLIIRDNHSKADLIFLNRDWTLDAIPKHIQVSEEDREYFKKFIK